MSFSAVATEVKRIYFYSDWIWPYCVNDIGSGSVAGCRLWSLGDLRRHTEMYYGG